MDDIQRLLRKTAFYERVNGLDVAVPWSMVVTHDCGSALCDRQPDQLLKHCCEAMAEEVLHQEALAYFYAQG